mmetsp:Transcript_27453/g.79023  ORF Transcript_27453/g.79023 Transcript_27453/m.79023 type:complete len:159 (-) Transcript_27453:841-1317(-)
MDGWARQTRRKTGGPADTDSHTQTSIKTGARDGECGWLPNEWCDQSMQTLQSSVGSCTSVLCSTRVSHGQNRMDTTNIQTYSCKALLYNALTLTHTHTHIHTYTRNSVSLAALPLLQHVEPTYADRLQRTSHDPALNLPGHTARPPSLSSPSVAVVSC